MDDRWFDERVAQPAAALLERLEVGGEVTDLERCRALGVGIEGCFRSEVAAQYAPWPDRSTTDGISVDLCVRTCPQTLDVAGLLWLDFDGAMFPFRTVITAGTGDEPTTLVASIGQVDPVTGEPPRLPRGTLVIPARDAEGVPPTAGLIAGRHQTPITWTEAFRLPRSPVAS